MDHDELKMNYLTTLSLLNQVWTVPQRPPPDTPGNRLDTAPEAGPGKASRRLGGWGTDGDEMGPKHSMYGIN